MSFSQLNRRSFLHQAVVAGGVNLIIGSSPISSHAMTAVKQERESPRANESHGLKKGQVAALPMQQVRLLPGYWKDAMERNREFLRSIPNDRLLHNFRVTAGIPSSAVPLGGWEAPNCELRGHFVGHYLSACALLFGSTGDAEVKDKVTELVSGLAACQSADGYLGAYPSSYYQRLRNFQRVWAPFYTYHKILAGLIDTYVQTGNQDALAVALRMADWADSWSAAIPADEFQKILLEEHGGIAESLYNLYGITKKNKYLAAAVRFEHHQFLDPLAENQDQLAGYHANTNIPKIVGTARAYELTGNPRYLAISRNFHNLVVEHHSYCTGGTSDEEYWFEPDAVSTRLGPRSQECCCAYNMLKLTRHLFYQNPDPALFDYYERVLLNVRYGTQDSQGMLMYYISMTPGLYRTYGDRFNALWCCTGTGTEEFAKLTDSIYFHDADSLYVNLFIASSLEWKERNFALEQTTRFPYEHTVTFKITQAPQEEMRIKIRVPHYAEKATLSVNGKLSHAQLTPGTYCEISRAWKRGDLIELNLPFQVRIEKAPDNHEVQAAMYGPLALAALLGTELLDPHMFYGEKGPNVQGRPHPLPRISRAGVWAEKVEGSSAGQLRFQTVGMDPVMTLVPFNEVQNQRFTIYLRNLAKA